LFCWRLSPRAGSLRSRKTNADTSAAGLLSPHGARAHRLNGPSLTSASSPGATVSGVAIEAGVPRGSQLAIGAEVALPARHDWTQASGYVFGLFQQEIRYRDLTVAAIANIHTRAAAAVVAGFELVRQDSVQRRTEGRLGPNGSIVYDVLGGETRLDEWTAGDVIGGEATVKASEHVGIVPEVRLHLIARDDVTTTIGSLNVAPLVVRAGVRLLASF
jgi:hypothetical protein